MTIMVFQAKSFSSACCIDGDVNAAKRLFINDGYQPVASVDTDDMEIAFDLTNSITCSWWENAEVSKMGEAEGYRSTSVGDIMLDANDCYWLVADFGFEKIGKINLDEVLMGCNYNV